MAIEVPQGYRALKEPEVARFLAELPAVAAALGGGGAEAWRVREVGDGNLNLVFIVEGPAGGVAVKQALPYVRLVGESWPLPLTRAFFEHRALAAHNRLIPERVPAILHNDPVLQLTVMEYLTPHIILRKGLIRGIVYPHLAEHMAEFMARTLFHLSDLGRPAADKKADLAVFAANTDLCKITEDLVFTDPYRAAPLNFHTSPQLDDLALALRRDGALKAAAQGWKWRFLTSGEALIHGDLHTGSIMVTPEDTRVIDAEFAFYGPMGFDPGAFIGNLFLAYFAQGGHEAAPGERDPYRAWILETVEATWTGFEQRFRALWRQERQGDAYRPELFADAQGPAALAAAEDRFLRRLFVDMLGFAGCKMIRRIFGLAHVEDLESIADPDRRAAEERRVVAMARRLVIQPEQYADIRAVTRLAEAIRHAPPPATDPAPAPA